MKRRIVFALISVLICVGAAVWLVPYTPVPDMDGFWNVRIWRVNGADMTVCELLPQIRARRLPSYHRGISEDCYQIQVVYGGKTVCFSLGEPSYAYEVTESMSPWVHKLSGSEKLLALLDKQ